VTPLVYYDHNCDHGSIGNGNHKRHSHRNSQTNSNLTVTVIVVVINRIGAQEAKDELHAANMATFSPPTVPPPPPPTALRKTPNPATYQLCGGERDGSEEEEVKEMQRLLAAMDIDSLRHGLGADAAEMMAHVTCTLRDVAREMQGMVKEEIGSIWMVSAPPALPSLPERTFPPS
jgi:hypothetical protein